RADIQVSEYDLLRILRNSDEGGDIHRLSGPHHVVRRRDINGPVLGINQYIVESSQRAELNQTRCWSIDEHAEYALTLLQFALRGIYPKRVLGHQSAPPQHGWAPFSSACFASIPDKRPGRRFTSTELTMPLSLEPPGRSESAPVSRGSQRCLPRALS